MLDHTSPTSGLPILGEGPAPRIDDGSPLPHGPSSLIAFRLMSRWRQSPGQDLLFIASSERRADEIGRALDAFKSNDGPEVLVFPPWDCLPYDRASPSRESMGRRMAVLSRLMRPWSGRIVVTSPDAAIQRTPPASALSTGLDLRCGQTLDRAELEAFALKAGYLFDDRIDEPGEIGILGEVIDVFPPDAPAPCRIQVSETGSIEEIRLFDPVTQRSDGVVEALHLGAASEIVIADGEDEEGRAPGCEHRLSTFYAEPLEDVFSFARDAVIMKETGVPERFEQIDAQILEAFDASRTFGGPDDPDPLPPQRLYLSASAMRARLAAAADLETGRARPTPAFALEPRVGPAVADYIAARLEDGRNVVISGLPHEHKVVRRLLKRSGVDLPAEATPWSDAQGGGPARIFLTTADLDRGFDDQATNLVVLTPTDITGGRLSSGSDRRADVVLGETELRPGDVVIHEDHGLGVMRGLEEVQADGLTRDVVRLEYQGDATLLVPAEELGRIWRYGADADAVSLDRLKGDAWARRRVEISTQIDATAMRMMEMAQQRAGLQTDPISPPKSAYARFTAGFRFPESRDQAAAIDAVLSDLKSGRPMNRLICGDVGFGKTEVALRAAAATALSGRQVILAAPTTVLARQHYETFRKRFEGTDVEIALLSRAVSGKDARDTAQRLADGSIRIAIGTHALAQQTLTFADLALVVIDEEHRFGAKLKADLAARAPHLLAMSATPIPRTLQTALVGVQDVSVIASPPARRRPIRTFLTGFDGGTVRTILLREKGRGGQSFVVAPQIDDLQPLADTLAKLVPELRVAIAHGKMPTDALDEILAGFAGGEGDILLSTNIIENGLDIPRANTILVWRPDRFGLAQLHQLRGRVGRGRRQGFAYLLEDPDAPVGEPARARLQTLEALDRLGAGFAISARDLDLRGGGDLIGDEQAGHIRLIGSAFYQKLLCRALKFARGEDPEPAQVRMATPAGGRIDSDYIPDEVVRLNLYSRLAHLTSADEIDALSEEMQDRFGPLPEPALSLLSSRRLMALAAAAGAVEITSGAKATAISFHPRRAQALSKRKPAPAAGRWSGSRLVVDIKEGQPDTPARIEELLNALVET